MIRDLELLPELGGQNWSAVFLQKFEGTVTIWPKSRGEFLVAQGWQPELMGLQCGIGRGF